MSDARNGDTGVAGRKRGPRRQHGSRSDRRSEGDGLDAGAKGRRAEGDGLDAGTKERRAGGDGLDAGTKGRRAGGDGFDSRAKDRRLAREEWSRGHWHRDHWHHGSRFGAQHPMRVKWFRRAAIAFAVLMMLALAGVFGLASLLTTKLGISGWSAPAAIAFAVLVAIGIAGRTFRAARRFASPLGAVMDGAARVADGDYTTRVEEHGAPPMRALVRSFNTMTERLEHADRQRRDLMADLAHELRTPLSVLQGRLEGMLDGIYRAEPRELEQLLEQTRVLARLIEDLRTLALSEAGALALQKEPVDLAALLRDTTHAFDAEAASAQVSLRLDASRDLQTLAQHAESAATAFTVDPVRVREVLSNLLSNALRHTPAGGSVVVALTIAGDTATVSVKDTGTGMSADEIARMFDRFQKGPESRGSGLGLAIAKHLVAAHGGEISAVSEPGKGTTVTFTLPRGE